MSNPAISPVPAFNFDAIVSMQKANLETAVAAQKIMFDLAQTVARRQAGIVQEMMGRVEGMMKGFDAARQPTDYVGDMRSAAEKVMAEVKETVDLGMRAQAEVVDLFVKRASANFETSKKAAA